MTIDVEKAKDEFSRLKSANQHRNYEYFLLRQAVRGNFRWPNDWPTHIPRIKRNMCKPITERHATFLMGKGFSYNVERPNTLEFRQHAERAEKILERIFTLSKAPRQFDIGAQIGSQLGRTIFKVYKKGVDGAQHAAFTFCQPDYFYGISAGDDAVGDFAKVYYSYPVDKTEAPRMFGPGDYRTEADLANGEFYDRRREDEWNSDPGSRSRRVPVLEVWTKDDYLLIVGGVVKYNGENPYKWKGSNEGYIPFVVIENVRCAAGDAGGAVVGEADIAQARELNEQLNYLLSQKSHIVQRYLRPTLVWEGAPQNYAESLAQTLGGGGAIPTRLGSKLYFLTHDRPNPAVAELQAELVEAILEVSGMNMAALNGNLQGSINTGPTSAHQLFPVTGGTERKRVEWAQGLKTLCAMLLDLQERIGDSTALGEAVVNRTVKSAQFDDGDLVTLSGKDINGLREVAIDWPGMLPKDDESAARLEMEKADRGLQSIYTTLEKLGEQYPDDELSRVRRENQDPSLRGEKVAEQMRAETPLLKQQQDQQFQMMQQMQQQAMGPAPEEEEDPFAMPEATSEEANIAQRLREIQAARLAEDEDGGLPVIETPGVAF